MEVEIVYVLIEWTGNSQEIDGAVLHGVFRKEADARRALNGLSLDRDHSAEVLPQVLR